MCPKTFEHVRVNIFSIESSPAFFWSQKFIQMPLMQTKYIAIKPKTMVVFCLLLLVILSAVRLFDIRVLTLESSNFVALVVVAAIF